MKNIILTMLLLMTSLVLHAQPYSSVLTSVDVTFPSTAPQTIVKPWNEKYAVTYIVNNGTPYVYCTEINTNASQQMTGMTVHNKIPLNINWTIYDMDINGDYAYLCGEYNSKGLFCIFNLNQLVTGTYIIHVYSYLFPEIRRLKKILTYKAFDPIQLPQQAFAGELYDQTKSLWRDCIVYSFIEDYDSPDYYYYAPLPADASGRERVNDILLSTKYVVFSNQDTRATAPSPIVVRRAWPDFIFGNSMGHPLIDTLHYYAFNGNEVEGRTYSTIMRWQENKHQYMATTYVHDGVSLTQKLHVIDVDRTMNIINSQSVPITMKHDPIRMIYSHDADKLVLMRPNALEYLTEFFFLEPGNTSIQYNTVYSYNALLYKPFKGSYIEKLNNRFFIATGSEFLYAQDMTSLNSSNSCMKYEAVQVRNIRGASHYSVEDELLMNYDVTECQQEYFSPTPVIMTGKCTNVLETGTDTETE